MAVPLLSSLALMFCSTTVLALSLVNHPPTAPTVQVSTVYEFPYGTWLENINQRFNGLILTTEVNPARLWQVDPSSIPNQTVTLVAELPQKSALLGLVEYAPDVFAVIGGNITLATLTSVAGSYSIFSVDFRTVPASVSLLADFPGSKLLNGLTFVPPSDLAPKGILLAADSMLGAIWSFNLDTMTIEIAAQDALMATCGGTILGINGLKYDDSHKRAYFTNTYCQGGFLASIPIDASTGRSNGAASIVGGNSQRISPDDFALAPERGVAYVAHGDYDQIDAVKLWSGSLEVAAGVVNTTEIAEPTAVWVGRTAEDRSKSRLYASTGGGLAAKINGTTVIGGQIVAIDLWPSVYV